jgi:FAD-dependent oxidoreductase domain-containing protein 1
MGLRRKVVIVGGGAMGSAAAYFLATMAGDVHDITVVERDPTYRQASSALSAAGIRRQFSTPANIQLSAFGVAFLRRSAELLAVGDDKPEAGFREDGYLLLAPEEREAVMRDNHRTQSAEGADVALLDPAALASRFPWLNINGLALGSLGLSGEGWFDAYGLLQGFRRKARSLGVSYIAAEASGFIRSGGRVAGIKLGGGETLYADMAVLAAGAWSAPLAATLDIDLPIRARRRSVFAFQCREPIEPCPLVVDPSGVWFRPEGHRQFIGGVSPADDPDDLPLEVNHAEWDDIVWPALAARVPAFEAVKVVNAWAGYYEYNTLDQNGVIGPHDLYRNLIFCAGFSGHGMQHAPGAGRAVAEIIANDEATSIDIAPLGWERIRNGRPLLERNVI